MKNFLIHAIGSTKFVGKISLLRKQTTIILFRSSLLEAVNLNHNNNRRGFHHFPTRCEFWKKADEFSLPSQQESTATTTPSSPSSSSSLKGEAVGWMENVGTNLGGFVTQVKETVVSTADSISNTNAIQQFNNLTTHLREIDIVKLGKEAEEKAIGIFHKRENDEKCPENEQERMNRETQNRLLKSVQDLFQNQEHPIHKMEIEKTGMAKLLNLVPFMSQLEIMFKYVIYQSLNAIFEAIRYSNLLNQEQKDQLVEDVSKIVIKNSLDPVSLAMELVEFTSLRLGADPQVANQLSYITKLLPYLKNVAGFVRQFKN